MSTKPLLSVVVPVYFNEQNLPHTWAGLTEALSGIEKDYRWELVFVDDGSGDGSYEKLKELHRAAPDRVRVVKLTRNFGQPSAILAGLLTCRGDCCIAMSADLQDPPELIPRMLAEWRGGERKIVLAARIQREDPALARWTSRIFYRLMRRYAVPNMPEGGFDFFLLDRRVIDLINSIEEKNTFLQGQILWTGFEPAILPYTRRKRDIGRSRWSLGMKIKYFVDGFATYTVAPIRLITLIGVLLALLSFSYAAFIFMLKLFFGIPIEGWAPLMIVILTTSGVHLMLLGVIGEYLWRNYHETRKLPNFVVESVLDSGEAAPGEHDVPGSDRHAEAPGKRGLEVQESAQQGIERTR